MMLYVPPAAKLCVHLAVFELPKPASATDPQPVIVLPPIVNATVPVGFDPVTVAVRVTLLFIRAGLLELPRVVVVGGVLPGVSVTASMKVVLSAATVPANPIVCVPLAATEKTTLKVAKLVLAGAMRLPTCVPSTVTFTGCV